MQRDPKRGVNAWDSGSANNFGPNLMWWGLFIFWGTMQIYLDESGDLGWNFSAPYLRGGSSRFLTLAALLVLQDANRLTERRLRQLYISQHWSRGEKKWAGLSKSGKTEFAKTAAVLAKVNKKIQYRAIVVNKVNVADHIRSDPNKLYNYMTKLLLLESIAQHESVELIPDRRSMKVESGNGMHDYLVYGLLFDKNSNTRLTTTPTDSQHCLNLQFADLLAGAIQSHFEFNTSSWFSCLEKVLDLKKLYY